jgi:hypothetical protein
LEKFPEPTELVTETAGVKAEFRQQIGVLAIIGVYLIRDLLAGLLRSCRGCPGSPAAAQSGLCRCSRAFLSLKLVKLRRPGAPYFRECIPGLQPGMRIDVAAGIWFPDLLAGRLADFPVPRRQSAPHC